MVNRKVVKKTKNGDKKGGTSIEYILQNIIKLREREFNKSQLLFLRKLYTISSNKPKICFNEETKDQSNLLYLFQRKFLLVNIYYIKSLNLKIL